VPRNTDLLEAARGWDASAAGVRVQRGADGVCLLVLDRPGCLNALDPQILNCLLRELESIAVDPGVRAVVLTGAGGAFSSGADLNLIEGLTEMPEGETMRFLAEVMRVSSLLWSLPQPTIAAVEGAAVGAGMSLALACDVRIASPRAVLFASFIRMGLLPDCGASWLLPRLIGEGAALELLLAGRPVDAEQALRTGLVSRVCEDPGQSALELAATFARRPATAVAATKRLVRQVAGGSLADAIETEAAAQAAAFHRNEFSDTIDAWRLSRTVD
jgi:enoyl-CoA hydratase/carnithine racemase